MMTIDLAPGSDGVHRPANDGGGNNGGGPTGPHAGTGGTGGYGPEEFDWRAFFGSLGTTFTHYNENGKMIVLKVVLGVLALIGLMWILNIGGAKGFNLLFFVGIGIFIITKGFSPASILAALGLGGLVGSLRDRDFTQGMVRGTEVLVVIVWGLLFYSWMTAGFLSVWSFQDNPFAFWYVFCFGLLILATMRFYGWPGETLPYLVVGFSAIVIIMSLWTTISYHVEELTGFDVHTTAEERAAAEEAAETREAAAAARARAQAEEQRVVAAAGAQICHTDQIPTLIPTSGEWRLFPNPHRCDLLLAREPNPHAVWDSQMYIAGKGWASFSWEDGIPQGMFPNIAVRIRHVRGDAEHFYARRPPRDGV